MGASTTGGIVNVPLAAGALQRKPAEPLLPEIATYWLVEPPVQSIVCPLLEISMGAP